MTGQCPECRYSRGQHAEDCQTHGREHWTWALVAISEEVPAGKVDEVTAVLDALVAQVNETLTSHGLFLAVLDDPEQVEA
jgi:hypothetical protein